MSIRAFIAGAFAAALAIAAPAHAAKTYTPAQLHAMARAGHYPPQLPPTTKTESMPYSACTAKIRSMVAHARPKYPAEIVVQTSILYIGKIWRSNAAVTLACGSADRKLVITTAKYR